MSVVTGLAEIVLWSGDVDRSTAFYGDLLGLQVISPPQLPNRFLSAGPGPGGVPMMVVLVPHPRGTDHGFPDHKPSRVLHHLAFSVDPVRYDELRRRCDESGLQTRDGRHPVLEGVRTFYVDDPDGNEVEIIAPAS